MGTSKNGGRDAYDGEGRATFVAQFLGKRLGDAKALANDRTLSMSEIAILQQLSRRMSGYPDFAVRHAEAWPSMRKDYRSPSPSRASRAKRDRF